ncbi:TetR family transcriptional regulator [Natranaerovirga pectinivora]|uniref:TetR family transcriptional regulator n=1 Tax=Natranaerovirga pectinivora TaxID=682400 RepID=A0A4R3MEQ0_9FIRM|nr:TetR/AcrR family transcriptional regulator [Natranaerovirga pectinivora]TCT12130.1 TetR family transcriptional regulator [Natranaerovirga pectinivora]
MKKVLHTKERIIFTTVEIINELGIQGLSTREIAKGLNISEGTIFKHFNTKNEILLAVLDHYSQFDEDIIKTTELKNLNPKEAILYFVNAYAEYYENYQEITAITLCIEVFYNIEELSKKIYDIFTTRINFIEKKIHTGVEMNLIKEVEGIDNLAEIIHGTIIYKIIKWRINKFNFSIKEEVNNSIQSVLNNYFKS